MIERFHAVLRRAYRATPFVFALTFGSAGAHASEGGTASPDNIVTENGAPNVVPGSPTGSTAVIFSPLPLRPGFRDDIVASPPSPIAANPSDQQCLAEAMYYEARGEGLLGEEAIAEVVFHRMQSGRFPRTICGVVYQGASVRHGCQFSFTCNGEMLRPRIASAWRTANDLAGRILSGIVQLGDLTGNAISFHASDIQPGWGEHLIRTIRIGRHIFYRSALHMTRAS